MGPYQIQPNAFDGGKFATRYTLDPTKPDFWISQNPAKLYFLNLRPEIVLPDDPPIFDPPDTPNIHNQKQAKEAVQKVAPSGVTLRAVALTLLDLINNTRQQMSPPLPQITRQQFATFLNQKIDSGAVDT